jgi:hypothetical protein
MLQPGFVIREQTDHGLTWALLACLGRPFNCWMAAVETGGEAASRRLISRMVSGITRRLPYYAHGYRQETMHRHHDRTHYVCCVLANIL